jgi:hypothetical protein
LLANRKTLAIAAVVLVAAASAGRLFLLLERPLWHDELFTLWAARMPAPDLIRALRLDSGPPLFYLAEKPFAAWAEAARFDPLVRLLSFVAGFLLFAFARPLTGTAARATFLALAASSPLLFVYSAEARAYALLSLLVLSLFLLCFAQQELFTRTRFIASAGVTALALGTHYLAIFFVAAAAIWLAVRRRWKPLAACLVGSVLFLPWIPVMRAQPEQAVAWMREPLGSSLAGFLAALGGTGRIPGPLGGPLPEALTWAGCATGLALLIMLARHALRDGGVADALAVALLPMALILLASGLRPVAFAGRSEMAFLPVWLWAVARGAQSSRSVRWLVAAAAGVGIASSLTLLAQREGESTALSATAEIVRSAGPGDAVLAAAAFYLPARLAQDRGRLQATLTALPLELSLHPGWIPARPLDSRDEDAISRVLSGLAPGRHAFLLAHPVLVTPRILALFERCATATPLANRPDTFVLGCTAR